LLQLLAQSVQDIDETQEVEIGRQLAAVLLGSKPRHPDAALQRYVNELGRWISLQSSRPQLPWTFVVLDDSGFNAFAAPGGYVFVTHGLVQAAGGEAELGGVLAHEITHVVEKHHLKSLNKAAQAALAGQLVASQIKNNLASAVASQFLDMAKTLYSKGLEREDEFDADRHGVVLAARAGLDPYGLPSLLQGLASVRPDHPQVALALSTHPPTELRLVALEQGMSGRLDAVGGANVRIAQRLGWGSTTPTTAAPVKPAVKPTRPAPPVKKPIVKPG
jgi:predicted Zn-dependent protease